MHIILGDIGHVGSALAEAFAEIGEQVAIITRDSSEAQGLRPNGPQVAVADVHDVEALRRVFRQGAEVYGPLLA